MEDTWLNLVLKKSCLQAQEELKNYFFKKRLIFLSNSRLYFYRRHLIKITESE